jgi:endonuclease/exonuclease/phosphatase family metal-dependent hydrolase
VPVSDTFTIASYNVENLFDLTDDGTEYSEFKPGQYNWTKATYAAKRDNIAAVIVAMRPDIAVLVEVESERAARDLARATKIRGWAFDYFAFGDRPHRTQTMPVILSRFPIAKTDGIAVAGKLYDSRNILEAWVAVDLDTIVIFANHWPSKSAPESYRLAAARSLRERIDQLSPGTDYLIAGDLNVSYNECETILFEHDATTRGRTSINHELGTVTSAPGAAPVFVTESQLFNGDRRHVYDLWLELPASQRFSLKYRGSGESPDHLLLPASLYDSAGISYDDNSFRVFTMDGKLLRNGEPYRWQVRFRGKARYHLGDGYSDHLPLVARFYRGPFRFTASSTAAAEPPSTSSSRMKHAIAAPAEWTGCDRGMLVSTAGTGVTISGDPGEKNRCAARMSITVAGASPRVSVLIKGHGKINFRYRYPGAEWGYFNAPAFSPAKSGRYGECRFDEWKKISLPLRPAAAVGSVAELEIRAGKGMRFEFCVDSIKIGR